MRLVFILAAAVGIVAIAILIFFLTNNLPSKDYSLNVDALKDEQSLFTSARIILTNNGRQSLTNVFVNYGQNKSETLNSIQPGEQIILSPPEGTKLDSVTVTADKGIKVVQQFRSPVKLPGMIGS